MLLFFFFFFWKFVSRVHFYSFLSVCRPGVVGVKCWDRLPCSWDMLYFGRALRTKETLPDFR